MRDVVLSPQRKQPGMGMLAPRRRTPITRAAVGLAASIAIVAGSLLAGFQSAHAASPSARPPGTAAQRYCQLLGAMYEAIGFYRNNGFGSREAGRNLTGYPEIEPARRYHAVQEVYYSPQFANPDISGLADDVRAACLAGLRPAQ